MDFVDVLKAYVHSLWNLNNLPINKKSLLSYVPADISGMKVSYCHSEISK